MGARLRSRPRGLIVFEVQVHNLRSCGFYTSFGVPRAAASSTMAEVAAESPPLGFDGVVTEIDDAETGYTVNFSSTERDSPEAAAQEEINLIEKGEETSDAAKVRRLDLHIG